MIYKDTILGIKSIPIEGEGHCPTLTLQASYYNGKESKHLTYELFKYLIRKFKKEIRKKGFDSFNLSPCFHFSINEPVTRPVYEEYYKTVRLCDEATMTKVLKRFRR